VHYAHQVSNVSPSWDNVSQFHEVGPESKLEREKERQREREREEERKLSETSAGESSFTCLIEAALEASISKLSAQYQ